MTRRTSPEAPGGARFALLVLGALVVLVVVGAWREHAAFPGDAAGRRWAIDHRLLPAGVRDLSLLLSVLGTAAPALVTLAVAAWAAARRWSGREAVALVLATGSVLVARALQDALGAGADQFIPTAYPSGHVVWATAVFGLLGLRAHRRRVPELAWPCLALVVLMGPQRVATGAHGVSDVLGGYALGLAWVLVLDRWLGPVRARGLSSRRAT